MVQQLRLHNHNAGAQGGIPGQATRPHMPQVKLGTAK